MLYWRRPKILVLQRGPGASPTFIGKDRLLLGAARNGAMRPVGGVWCAGVCFAVRPGFVAISVRCQSFKPWIVVVVLVNSCYANLSGL